MLSKVLTTPVDELVELIRKNENCTINFLKNSLKVPYAIVEKWIVVLEEYKVIEVRYQGFEGFVKYIEKKDEKVPENASKKIDIYNIKEEFLRSSSMRNLSNEEMHKLWPKFVLSYENELKELFVEEAKKRNFSENQINMAWKRYKEELVRL